MQQHSNAVISNKSDCRQLQMAALRKKDLVGACGNVWGFGAMASWRHMRSASGKNFKPTQKR